MSFDMAITCLCISYRTVEVPKSLHVTAKWIKPQRGFTLVVRYLLVCGIHVACTRHWSLLSTSHISGSQTRVTDIRQVNEIIDIYRYTSAYSRKY
jgi:hypothetical protein